MNTSIQKILNELSEAISNELTAANDREVAQEAEISRLRDGIVVLLQGATASAERKPKKQPPANDHDAPAIARASAGKKRPPSVPNEDFLNALTYQWITAGNLWKRLKERGIAIGEGTVYNRMRKLTAEYPDEAEATDMPERWRRKIPVRAQDSEKSRGLKVARQRKRPVAQPRLRLVSSASVIANDNGTEVLKPRVSIPDPFMGNGATGVAAMRCGCKFVGIELDHGYCEAAAKRIAAEAGGAAATLQLA